MKSLRIKFPASELSLLEDTVKRFNDFSEYLDKIKIKTFQKHQLLFVPIAESVIFVESYLQEFPRFSKERIKRELVKQLEVFLKENPDSLPAEVSLTNLRDLSF
jgi:hypothetical protein